MRKITVLKSADKDKEHLFALPYDADEPVLLRKGSYRGIAVIDREWVYLQERTDTFIELSQKGRIMRRFFETTSSYRFVCILSLKARPRSHTRYDVFLYKKYAGRYHQHC